MPYVYKQQSFSSQETLPNIQATLNQLGANGWRLVHGSMSIFEKTTRSIIYKAEKMTVYGEQMVPVFNQLGAQGWTYIGTISNTAVFEYTGVRATYSVIPLSAPNMGKLEQSIPEKGNQGYIYVDSYNASAIFKSMGRAVSLYATGSKPEWAGNIPGALNEVGADGWQFIGDCAGRAVFHHVGTPITYSAVDASNPIPGNNFEQFLNTLGSINLRYIGFALNHYGFQH